jgi:hypothetical protein
MRVDSTRLRVDRIDTHLRHTNPTALRVESTRDFLLCTYAIKLGIFSRLKFLHGIYQKFTFPTISLGFILKLSEIE